MQPHHLMKWPRHGNCKILQHAPPSMKYYSRKRTCGSENILRRRKQIISCKRQAIAGKHLMIGKGGGGERGKRAELLKLTLQRTWLSKEKGQRREQRWGGKSKGRKESSEESEADSHITDRDVDLLDCIVVEHWLWNITTVRVTGMG